MIDELRRFTHVLILSEVIAFVWLCNMLGWYAQHDCVHCCLPLPVSKTIVTWCRHQTETFSALLVLCEGNPPMTSVRWIYRSQLEIPLKGRWRGALMFSLICAGTNGWANNRDAGDFRCHRAHYDIIDSTPPHCQYVLTFQTLYCLF